MRSTHEPRRRPWGRPITGSQLAILIENVANGVDLKKDYGQRDFFYGVEALTTSASWFIRFVTRWAFAVEASLVAVALARWRREQV